MITTIIFDFDGTLADTLPFVEKKLFKMLKEEKIKITYKQMIEDFRSKQFSELMNLWKISWLKLPIILKKIKQSQIDLYEEIGNIKIFPGVKKILYILKKEGFKLTILSSNLENNILKFLKINKLNVFEKIHAGSQILGKSKAINEFIKQNNWKKNEVLYIGDEIRDIEACKKSDIKIIAVGWGMHKASVLKNRGADYIVKKPTEILKIIQKL